MKILDFVRSKKDEILIFKVKIFNFESQKMVALLIVHIFDIFDLIALQYCAVK